jgi:hypothetical protein
MGVALNFDATTVKPSTGGTSTFFPHNDYPVRITGVESTPVKDNPEKGFLAITSTVTHGEYAGASIVHRLNIFGAHSAKAIEIGYSELSAYMHSIGYLRLGNSDELIGKELVLEIGPQQGSDKYSEVKRIKNMNLQVAGMGAPAPAVVIAAQAAAPAAANTDAAPWASAVPAAAPAAQPAIQSAAVTAAAPAGGAAPPWQK